ncbi:hypothetical protein M0805_005573 [Coniferiporia weirii]|nr:hypothetical protein M0805_005573 [Coniferiporia weirii]
MFHNLPLPPFQAIREILRAQETAQSIDYNNMLSAATFFSAVTATTLQLSYAYNVNPHASFGIAVNTLWFVALVFSTASSLSSLVGLMWYQKIRRIQLLPDWAKLWVEYGPTISLAVASAAFSAGLCLFAFSSSQHIITSSLATAFTATHAVVLFLPLCLYSPNPLSRFLLKVFTTSFMRSYCKEVYLKWWYMRGMPRQDRALVLSFLHKYGIPLTKSTIIDTQRHIQAERALERESRLQTGSTASTSSTGNASPDSIASPIGVKRNIKMAWIFVRSSAHSALARLVTRWPDWMTLRRRSARATKESGEVEQKHGVDAKVTGLSKVESDIGYQEDVGEPRLVVTEGQDTAPSEESRTLTPDTTNPDQGAAHAAKRPGKEVRRSFDTRATPESTKELTAVTSSMTDLVPGLRPSPTVQNSDKGLENVERQETDAFGKLNQLKEEEPAPSSDFSVQESVEAHKIGASNHTSEVERSCEGIKKKGRPSTDLGRPDNVT